MAKSYRREARNRLLSALSVEDLDLLWPHFDEVALGAREVLQRPGERIDAVYFLETGIASVVAIDGTSSRVEIGLVGSEGCTGLPILLGDDRSPHETVIQVPGRALRMSPQILRRLADESQTLRAKLLGFAHAFMIQISYTALANGRHKLESRLARWLLMCLDRVEGDELPLTHEAISAMLGVRRAGVTLAMHMLEGKGYIRTGRSRIAVLDRKGLGEAANGSYGVPEQEYRRLVELLR